MVLSGLYTVLLGSYSACTRFYQMFLYFSINAVFFGNIPESTLKRTTMSARFHQVGTLPLFFNNRGPKSSNFVRKS